MMNILIEYNVAPFILKYLIVESGKERVLLITNLSVQKLKMVPIEWICSIEVRMKNHAQIFHCRHLVQALDMNKMVKI